jgi:hypothetical protein
VGFIPVADNRPPGGLYLFDTVAKLLVVIIMEMQLLFVIIAFYPYTEVFDRLFIKGHPKNERDVRLKRQSHFFGQCMANFIRLIIFDYRLGQLVHTVGKVELIPGFFFRVLFLGNVIDKRNIGCVAIAFDKVCCYFSVAQGLVKRQKTHLAFENGFFFFQAMNTPVVLVAVFFDDEVEIFFFDNLAFAFATKKGIGRFIRKYDFVAVNDQNRVGRVFHQAAIFLFAFHNPDFRQFAFGNIAIAYFFAIRAPLLL